jgi:hypothetical protein
MQGADHSQLSVESTCRIGVDGEWATGLFDVTVDQLGRAAADDGDEGADWELEESFGCYGGGEAAEKFLAVLCTIALAPAFRQEGLRKPYTAEEVTDEDDQDPPGAVAARVQTLEGVRFPAMVEDGVILYLA